MKHYIYALYKKNFNYTSSNIEEGLFYIGITTDTTRRKKSHKSQNDNPLKMNYIRKYDFNLVVLYEEDSRENAELRETFLIKWFGLINEGGILTNLCKDMEDCMAKARKYVDSDAIKRGTETRKKNFNPTIARDARLTVPYHIIMQLIEEWAKNPLIGISDFAKSKNIARSKFKDWVRLYKPEYSSLHTEAKNAVYMEMEELIKNGKEPVYIINFINTKYNIEYARSIYYTRRNRDLLNNKKIKYFKQRLNDNYRIKKLSEWEYSNLSLGKFCKNNEICTASMKAWVVRLRPDLLCKIQPRKKHARKLT